MNRTLRFCIALALVALPMAAQTNNSPDLVQAQQVLVLADAAGAQQYAKSLYDDAAYRIRFAQENLNAPKSATQQQAQMRAREALFAARAALAKARWLSTNAAVRNLQTDINRFGGHADVALRDEDVNIDFHRGSTTKDRIATAQAAIDQARAAGAEQSVMDNDLKGAQDELNSAQRVSLNGRDNSEVADHLAYIAEMTARRAYYLARLNESSRFVPDLQMQRTRLAQSSTEQQAAAERAQRQAAEQQTAELQRQLAAQEANRQAEAAELQTLREQVQESRRAMLQRTDADRAARIEAEKRLDDAMRQYEAAVANGNPADVDRLRRLVEDQEIALRNVQERERLDAQAMAADVNSMQNAAQRAEAESALNQYRAELQADVTARTNIQQHHEAAIAAEQQQRQQAEAQAQTLRAQLEQAQQAAQTAQQQAQQTQQQLQAAQQQAQQQLEAQQKHEAEELTKAQQAAQAAQQQLTQQAEQNKAEAEKARQAAAAAQAELEKTRQALAQREEEARQLRMQQELARIVSSTKTEPRGIVVTLPGIFFDPGKTTLKAGAKKTLQRIGDQLKANDTIRVTVEGHTDNVGNPDKNLEISEKRAEAVRDYLVSQGVAGDRIIATGKGETEPVATNKTAAGRQQNRRVELIINM